MNTKDSLSARIAPHLSPELIGLLEEAFPIHNAVPRVGHPIEATWVASGTRQVIDFLQFALEENDPLSNVSGQ